MYKSVEFGTCTSVEVLRIVLKMVHLTGPFANPEYRGLSLISGPKLDRIALFQRVLAEEFGVHRTTVLHLLRREGAETRRKIRLLNGEHVDRAVELYRSGLSLAKVGEQLGVSASTVQRELAKAGVELRPSKRHRGRK